MNTPLVRPADDSDPYGDPAVTDSQMAATAPVLTGWELDEAIALRVMEFQRGPDGYYCNVEPFKFWDRRDPLPPFGANIAAAWLVVEKCIERGLDVELQTLSQHSHQWRCCIGSAKDCWHVYHTDGVASLAICRAALAAVEPAPPPSRADD